MKRFDDGSMKLEAKHSGHCIEVANESQKDGEILIQNEFRDQYHQKFRMEKIE